MAEMKFEESVESGRHAAFKRMAGEWEGRMLTWFEPTRPEDDASINGNIKSLLDGRFVMHEYQSSFKGKPFSGMMIIGYSIATDSFQCAWIDSFHTGTLLMFSESAGSDKLFSALGSYTAPGVPEPWGWRTEITMPDENNLIITAYNITPQGEEAIATEIKYNRKR